MATRVRIPLALPRSGLGSASGTCAHVDTNEMDVVTSRSASSGWMCTRSRSRGTFVAGMHGVPVAAAISPSVHAGMNLATVFGRDGAIVEHHSSLE